VLAEVSAVLGPPLPVADGSLACGLRGGARSEVSFGFPHPSRTVRQSG